MSDSRLAVNLQHQELSRKQGPMKMDRSAVRDWLGPVLDHVSLLEPSPALWGVVNPHVHIGIRGTQYPIVPHQFSFTLRIQIPSTGMGPLIPLPDPQHLRTPHLILCSCCVSGSLAEKVATEVPGGAPSAMPVLSGFSGNTGASLMS